MNEQNMTGYPSIDKPWLKYYSEEALTAALPEGSMYEYMTVCNAGRMEETALNYFGRKITHRQLQAEIDRCARALIACGVKAGDVVSLCMLAMPEAVYLLYAVNKIGAVCNMVVLNTSGQEMAQQLTNGGKLVITVDVAAKAIVGAAKEAGVGQIVMVPVHNSMPLLMRTAAKLKAPAAPSGVVAWADFIRQGQEIPLAVCPGSTNAPAVIEYTGGTTGLGKGVLLTSISINTVAFHYRYTDGLFEFHIGERFLSCVPLFLAVGLSVCLHMPLCMGFEVILSPDPSPQAVPRFVQKYRPNHVLTGALHIDQIMADKVLQKTDLSFLYTVACGGDKKSESWAENASHFLREHHARHELINGYGLSEVAGSFCTTTHNDGKMLPFVRNNLMIIDPETETELSYDCEGEVLVSGPSLMSAYYNEKSGTDVFCTKNGVRWLRTGDLGKISPEGNFSITGRIKRVLWAAGEDKIVNKVYPSQIEEVISSDPAVKDCAVVGVPNEERGFLPVAFIKLKGKCQRDETVSENIYRICRENLKANSQPHELFFVEEFPHTRAGKVDYRALERMAAEGKQQQP